MFKSLKANVMRAIRVARTWSVIILTSMIFLGLFIVIISAIWGYILSPTINSFNALENEIKITLLTISGTALISVFSVTYGRYSEKKKEIEQRIRERKTEIYEELSKAMFAQLAKASKTPSEARSNKQLENQEDLATFFSELNPKFILWGSDAVLAKWSEFKSLSINQSSDIDPMDFMLKFEGLLLAIRKDLGHSNKRLNRGKILKLFINDVDEHLYKKQKKR